FVIFLAVAGKPIYRAIAKQLDSRAERIKGELDEARRLRDEAEQLLADNQRMRRDAAKEAEAILAHARSEAARLRSESEASLAATMARREKMALDKIAQAEAQAVQEVRAEAVDLAVAATRKLLARMLDRQRSDALVDAAIAEVEKRLH